MLTTLALMAMAITMFATGLGLHDRELIRAYTLPVAVLIGLILQTLLLPVVAALLINATIPASAEGMGLFIVTIMPATAASHVFVGLAGGNIGLAKTLTGCSSIISLVVMSSINLENTVPDFWKPVFWLYLLPLILGISFGYIMGSPPLVRLERRLFMLGSGMTGITIVAVLLNGFGPAYVIVFFLAMLLTIIFGLLGAFAGGFVRRGIGEAIGVSVPMQNVSAAVAICLAAGLNSYAVSAAVYAIAMYLAVFGLMVFWRWVG